MDKAEDFGTKWRLFWALVMMKLLSHELKAATSGRAAARREDLTGERRSTKQTANSQRRSASANCGG